MKNYFLHDDAGKIHISGTCQATDFQRHAQAGFSLKEGEAHPLRDYFDGASVQPLPPKPSQHHVFDYAVKGWKPDFSLAEAAVRQQRDQLIGKSDWTTLADVPLSEQARLQWAAYRQALRDVTSQAGFPQKVDWPEAPSNSTPPRKITA